MEEQLKLLESSEANPPNLDAGTTTPVSGSNASSTSTTTPATTTTIRTVTSGALQGQGETTGGTLSSSLGGTGPVGAPIEMGSQGQPIGPPGEQGGFTEQQRALFEQVQADPRMQQLREQFEGGQLSEQQAREKVFEVLRDHGMEPNNGQEWDHEGMRGEGMAQEGVRGELGERGEGFERAFERMDSNAREQMERLFGEHETTGAREQEQHETFREMMEREFGTSERTMDSSELQRETDTQERMYEAPTSEAPTRESETPTREMETTTREYEAPTYEAPTKEYDAPTSEYDRPQYEYQGTPSP